MLHKFCLPGAAVPLLSRDTDQRAATLKFLKAIIDMLLELKTKTAESTILTTLMDDIGFWTETLPCEIMAELRQIEFEDGEKLRGLQFLLSRLRCGTSSTKELLESCFAHLTDVSIRSNKNKRMAPFPKWLYACASPLGKKSAPQLWPEKKHWLQYSPGNADLAQRFNSLLNVAQTKLPVVKEADIPKSAQELRSSKKVRSAGFDANMNAAAAVIFALGDFESGFENAQHANLGR